MGLRELQQGKPDKARVTLSEALRLNPANELAGKLLEQVDSSPRTTWGGESFRYTIPKNYYLSRIAGDCLGDWRLFYSLALYNNIPVPDNVKEGDTIDLPKKIAKNPCRTRTLEPQEPRHKPTQPSSYEAPAIPSAPACPSLTQAQLEGVANYRQQAKKAQGNYEFTKAIELWDRVLRIDPCNSEAKLEKDEVVRIRDRR